MKIYNANYFCYLHKSFNHVVRQQQLLYKPLYFYSSTSLFSMVALTLMNQK